MQVAYSTHVGNVRNINQDSFFVGEPFLFIIADGMGGHNAGEVASFEAVSYVRNELEEDLKNNYIASEDILDRLAEAVTGANTYVYNKSLSNDKDFMGMGTTMVCLVINNNKAYIANVGDSRLYLLRNGELKQVTSDHSYVAELVKAGSITKQESINHPQKNIITRAIGTTEKVEVDINVQELHNDDIIIMCTDGVTNMLDDDKLTQELQSDKDINTICDNIINKVNINGGLDNSTLIIIKL